jgi:hypothetical protein
MRDKPMTLSDQKKETVSMCEYFSAQIENLKEYMEIKFKAIEDSTKLAQDNLNGRLSHMNEFRETISDQTKTYITRNEHNVMMTKYDAQIEALIKQVAIAEGKASTNSVYIGYIIAFIGIVMGIAGLILKF